MIATFFCGEKKKIAASICIDVVHMIKAMYSVTNNALHDPAGEPQLHHILITV